MVGERAAGPLPSCVAEHSEHGASGWPSQRSRWLANVRPARCHRAWLRAVSTAPPDLWVWRCGRRNRRFWRAWPGSSKTTILERSCIGVSGNAAAGLLARGKAGWYALSVINGPCWGWNPGAALNHHAEGQHDDLPNIIHQYRLFISAFPANRRVSCR